MLCSPLNSTHYVMLYPQNGDRILAIDVVTSLHPMYSHDTIAIVWVYHDIMCGDKGRRFTVLFK